ncbi:hypothetical protein BDZ97DRAFT_1406788 [Flammula alnicola]|nr:hypothetical protein BDZ97DRAFT_1406788 [Flammula alnicola]
MAQRHFLLRRTWVSSSLYLVASIPNLSLYKWIRTEKHLQVPRVVFYSVSHPPRFFVQSSLATPHWVPVNSKSLISEK